MVSWRTDSEDTQAFVLVFGAVLAGLLTGLFAPYGDSGIRALFFA